MCLSSNYLGLQAVHVCTGRAENFQVPLSVSDCNWYSCTVSSVENEHNAAPWNKEN